MKARIVLKSFDDLSFPVFPQEVGTTDRTGNNSHLPPMFHQPQQPMQGMVKSDPVPKKIHVGESIKRRRHFKVPRMIYEVGPKGSESLHEPERANGSSLGLYALTRSRTA